MIRDRGRMKWVSMMLPEHVKVLREWAEEDSYQIKKELDEQQLERMNGMLAEAMAWDRAIKITYYQNKQYELFTGCIRDYDGLAGCLKLEDDFGGEHRLYLKDITDVQWADTESV